MCLVARSLNESEVGVDLVLMETSLLSLCEFLLICMRTALIGNVNINLYIQHLFTIEI